MSDGGEGEGLGGEYAGEWVVAVVCGCHLKSPYGKLNLALSTA